MDDVVQLLTPDPDSQWRLKDCQCGSDQVVYLQRKIRGQLPWEVRCMTCGRHTRPDTLVRHTAQVQWNQGETVNEQKEDSICQYQ